MKSHRHASPMLRGLARCTNCKNDLPHPAEFVFRYFTKGGKLRCGYCGTEFDCWSTVMRVLELDFPVLGGQAYTFLGARLTLIPIELTTNQTKRVDFLESDVPENSYIVCINYTPEEGVFPLEVHGNQPVRGEHPKQVTLFGRPAVDGSIKTAKVKIAVTWIPEAHNFAPWQSLVDAIDAFAQERYARMVIPANVFVEVLTRSVLSELLMKHLSKERVDEFLSNTTAYSDQINVLLPTFAALLALQPMPDQVRGMLNRLRKLRNSVVHGRIHEIQLSRHDAAELLCGALMGAGYCFYVQSQLRDI